MIPYTDDSAHVEDDYCTARRLEETIRFIREEDLQAGVLDVSDENYVARKIAERFAVKIWHTTNGKDIDFAYRIDAEAGSPLLFGCALCLEVFEHSTAPVYMMRNIRWQLHRGGVLYLSTPVRNPYGFMFNTTAHFNEYTVDAVKTCLEYAGFKVTDVHTFRSIPFWQGMIRGGGLFRTFLRVRSQRTMLIRAVR